MDDQEAFLEQLYGVIVARFSEETESSYVARLHDKGIDAILKKVGEEATETILAAKGGDDQAVIHETADLWFHTLVMLAQRGITPEAVVNELRRRFGVSGVVEKASRRKG
ncbi:MAG: phosphoribosyl-ATP diphosphatase [Magnetococcales bacterium]|nr:phosphoribosyl-ATP diphosphatase [Magnetococcales bacterium]